MNVDVEKLLSIAFLVPMGEITDPRCRWGLNVMLWGEPGIGKSERVEVAGMRVGLPVRTTYVPTCQPEDASGTAFVNTTKLTAMLDEVLLSFEELADNPELLEEHDRSLLGRIFDWVNPGKSSFVRRTIKRLANVVRRYGPSFSRIEPLLPGVSDLLADGQGVWFLDELTSGRPAVQAGFLGAALARRVGGLSLPPKVRIVAAGNPPESAAGGWELEPPMANRWCHFNVPTPSVSAFGEWWVNEGQLSFDYIEEGEARVKQAWGEHYPATKGRFIGFLHTNPGLLHAMPAEGHKDRGRAWPSPRTMVFAARAVATCKCLGIDAETTDAFVAGCVGEGAATALSRWIYEADLPSPQEVLKNGWKIDKRRLDRCMAVYTSIVSYVISREDKAERLKLGVKAWQRLQDTVEANLLDLTLPAAHTLVKAGLDSRASQEMLEASHPVMSRLAKEDQGRFLPGVKK